MAKKDKNEDEYKDNLDNSSMQDDEDFGLPDLDDETTNEPTEEDDVEIEITTEEQLAADTITFADEEPSDDFEDNNSDEANANDEYTDDEYEDEEEQPVGTYTPPKQSSAPIIITLSIIVILACIAVYFFFIHDSAPVEKPVVVEKDTTTYVVEKPMEIEEPVIEEEPVKEIATINTLSVRSGRSYVVVGSFFDDDLAMDYAKELKGKGTTSYVIPPFGKSKFTRVAVKESSSFADASSMANELAGQYKEQPWPLKY